MAKFETNEMVTKDIIDCLNSLSDSQENHLKMILLLNKRITVLERLLEIERVR